MDSAFEAYLRTGDLLNSYNAATLVEKGQLLAQYTRAAGANPGGGGAAGGGDVGLEAFSQIVLDKLDRNEAKLEAKLDRNEAKLDSMSTRVDSRLNAISSQIPTSGRGSTQFWQKQMDDAVVCVPLFERLFSLVSPTDTKEAWLDIWRALEDPKKLHDPKKVNTLAKQAKSYWKQCNPFPTEDFPQALMSTVHMVASQSKEGLPIVAIDTSSKFAPLNPHHKFDHTLVETTASCAVGKMRVSWSHVVAIEQIKRELDASLLKDGRQQIADGLLELLTVKQRDREYAIGMLDSFYQIEFFHMDQQSKKVTSSGILDFMIPSDTFSDGFVLYLRLMRSSPAMLGFKTTIVDIPFHCVSLLEDKFKLPVGSFQFIIERPSFYGKPTIFRVMNQTPQAEPFTDLAVKKYIQESTFSRERVIYELFSEAPVSVKLYLPSLVLISVRDMCIAFSPFAIGTLHTMSYSDEVFLAACIGGARVLSWLAAHKLVYHDIHTQNVLVVKASNGTLSCIFNDFGDAGPTGVLDMFVGTHAFASPALVELAQFRTPTLYGLCEDLDSLLFTLLSYAWADPQHIHHRLPWELQENVSALWLHKLVAIKKFFLKPDDPPLQANASILLKKVWIYKERHTPLETVAFLETEASSIMLSQTVSGVQISSSADVATVYRGRGCYHKQVYSHGLDLKGRELTITSAIEELCLSPCRKCF